MPARGAEPQGAANEQSAGRAVQSMFNEIAPRYDLLNHVLSANIDRLWWRRTARNFRHILQQPEATIVDLCCGTGDMTLALLHHRPQSGTPVLAMDFAHAMLVRGQKKLMAHNAIAIEADALAMPLTDNTADLVITAFGFRNLANYNAGLHEIYRVLRPGGEIGILDFSEPSGMKGKLYQFYFRHVLPRIGRFLSGTAGPYAYLPQSVHRFPSPDAMVDMMRACGFSQVSWTPYTFGIAGLYRAVKP
ncbi:MAG TPA: ubiquinone/menaquinone biosynthesis methyltransferase [Acidobacteriaceae bacterium]|jgi:demethylmenaquinone methyltransferase/2-methoxy-6-polyprenyl-1,4-benzoquinol methylase|nr:ubiquinone/menaquinone biosynthesis methyltransferase [Acidobacteriaceae bacterium]